MPDSITILAVDDEPNNLRALKLDLEDNGYRALTARDGVEAWDILQKNMEKISVILLDRMMPNMNGMEFIAKIKADKTIPSIPVIMQTAAAEKEQVVEGIKAGAYYYLTKPYHKDVMLSITAAAVRDYANLCNLRFEVKKITRKLSLIREANFEAKTLDDVQDLSTFLSQFYPSPESVVLGISELLTNAVEHGNLGITYNEKSDLNKQGQWKTEVERRLSMPEHASKIVRVAYNRGEDQITLTIKDEGVGFNWMDYMEISPERATHSHGRGIALAKMMSFDQLDYLGDGNEVQCRVTI
jgi:CheY-like chemotaxis protein